MGDEGSERGGDLVLGLDEAGRGSLVGPLVVGGFLTTADAAQRLPDLEVRDSKLLSRRQRSVVYERLGSAGRAFSISVPPSTVDRYVALGRLNALEAESFARIIRRAGPRVAYVDACDPVAERFGSLVASLADCPTRVVARHHADRDLPVVGAASIVAKVRRDAALGRLRASLGDDLGSGYPSDPKTVAYVRATLERRGPLPKWLRHSWATTERLMDERSARTLEQFGP